MERKAPTRKPSSSMAGLLKWMEGPPPDPEALASCRLHQVRLASRGECGVCFAVADSDPKERNDIFDKYVSQLDRLVMGVINPLFGDGEMAELTGDDIFKADATADLVFKVKGCASESGILKCDH
ncbi:hypothetical protein OPV22_015259 [Ensete ventricosum]|uniref:Uncharacterized protein n=1 Tax=Ensete ventricosum TaxID=4639 RepID=A0AAV8PLN3_ENSVE|nr:hypothetical protein OPV22_015259 [Ensete ventricosum]